MLYPVTPENEYNVQTILAEERTVLAADRTLMAWMRTALSMIVSGFAIGRVFAQWTQEGSFQGRIDFHDVVVIGLGLVLTGTLLLFAATVQHWMYLGKVEREIGEHVPRWSLAMYGAVLLQLLGVAAIAFIVMRVFS